MDASGRTVAEIQAEAERVAQAALFRPAPPVEIHVQLQPTARQVRIELRKPSDREAS